MFLGRSDGGTGELTTASGLETPIDLWQVGVLMGRNTEYSVPKFLPGHFAIGSDGGSELLVIEVSQADGPVYLVPACDLDVSARWAVAACFSEIIEKLATHT
jgi:hypothetical protein